MHASYQIIIQVLQLAYTTQACIFEFENLCNASKHMNMHISNAINQSSWACSPYLCASLVQEFWSIYFLQCCSLFVHIHVQPLKLSYLISPLTQFISPPYKSFHIFVQSLPFVINFHKRCVSHWCKGIHFGVDGWGLSLVFFMDITWLLEWHHLYIPLVTCTPCILCRASWDTTLRFFDLVINLCDNSPLW